MNSECPHVNLELNEDHTLCLDCGGQFDPGSICLHPNRIPGFFEPREEGTPVFCPDCKKDLGT